MHILIIEDDADIATTIEQFINMEFDVSCRIASSNALGIASLGLEKPNVILLDYILADGPCDIFIVHCRSLSHCPPIIMISASSNAEQCVTRFALPYFLKKPFDLEELNRLIKKFLVD